ncbi:AT-rich interactive domain-containing protein 1B-like [Chanos chanos]|uniref:AT-rich interactive domain-containing protein 1B-like n=1 Tax=Chanos chanos TaxID=29144 RepID=A0A6J2WHK4_CHACN|nr:AT-rich interactive domain-containing protein 1B-like [Chanos chanos]
MEPVPHSPDGYHGNHYGHHTSYRQGYRSVSYGTIASHQDSSVLGQNMNSAPSHGKPTLLSSVNNAGGYQRGPTQKQHPSGATPTLNQLLTSPSPLMRNYGSGCQEFNSSAAHPQTMGLSKDLSSRQRSVVHGWGGQRNHLRTSPGNSGQGVNGHQGLGGGVVSFGSVDFMATKRSQVYGSGNNPYSQQSVPYPSQLYGSRTSPRYPMKTQGRGQLGMDGMPYFQQQAAPPFCHQGMGRYCKPDQPPYLSQSSQKLMAPTQPLYTESKTPSLQAPEESYGNKNHSTRSAEKANPEEMGLIQQDHTLSVPDQHGSSDEMPTDTEAGIHSMVNLSGSTTSQGEQGNPGQSSLSPHTSPQLSGVPTGPSPSPVGSPLGTNQSRSGPISPSNIPGFTLNVQKSQTHCGPQQSGSSASPNPPLGGQMRHGIDSYQQGSFTFSCGPQVDQCGPKGNCTKAPSYESIPSTNYSGPGPGSNNGQGINAISTMHGQEPEQSVPMRGNASFGNRHLSGMAPSSPRAVGMTEDGMMAAESKQKADNKEEEPPKIKSATQDSSQCMSPPPSSLSSSSGSLSPHHTDDSDGMDSPAWPKIPSSPKSGAGMLTDVKISHLYEMGVEPGRRVWVDRFLSFMKDRGTAVPHLPTIGKKPLDIYKLYMAVRELGGLATVNKNKKWHELCCTLSVGTANSSASSLKRHYIQYLFAYECKVERGAEALSDSSPMAEKKMEHNIHPPSPVSPQDLHNPQATVSTSMAEMPSDSPHTSTVSSQSQMNPLSDNRSNSISIQDPFSEISQPAFQKHNFITAGGPRQSGLNMDPVMRIQFDNKDPFAGMKKGVRESYMTGGMQDRYSRGTSGRNMPGLSQHSQYPYGPGHDRRHEGYSQQYPAMPYVVHPAGMYSQHQDTALMQGYKRPLDGIYSPPGKRHEGEAYNFHYGSQQLDMYGQCSVSYLGSDRQPVQGLYPYGQDLIQTTCQGLQQQPQHHRMMSRGPLPPVNVAEGLQHNLWPPRTDMSYTYPIRCGQGFPNPGIGHRDDLEDMRAIQDSQWPGHHWQSSFVPSSSSAMIIQQPLSSNQSPNHLSCVPSSAALQSPFEAPILPNKFSCMSSIKMPKKGNSIPGTEGTGSSGQMRPNSCRDLNYPVGSVEATQPLLKPQHKITSKDTGTPEAWRVMMSLKSGLLAESTWALDTINILLYDDSTVASFNLSQLPGFLEIIVEYFRRCLIEIFGIMEEYEVGSAGQKTLFEPSNDLKVEDCPPTESPGSREEVHKDEVMVKKEQEVKEIEAEQTVEEISQTTRGQSCVMSEPRPKQASKYDKLPVMIVSKDDFIEDVLDDFDHVQEFSSGLLHWKAGGGDTTTHIQTHFGNRGEAPIQQVRLVTAKVKEEKIKKSVLTPLGKLLCTCSKTLLEKNKSSSSLSDASYLSHQSQQQIGLLEDEPCSFDKSPLSTVTDWQDGLARRCLCISNIIRSLSFIPGNDSEMSHHPGLVLILGRLLLLHHEHPKRRRNMPICEREDVAQDEQSLACSKDEWRWDCLAKLRENTLVTLANIAGQLDLSVYPESICLPILDGLLHWMVCPSAEAQDPFPSAAPCSLLSPRGLVLESLCKLSVQDNNVDLILATPPLSRQENLFTTLVQYVGHRKQQVYREMAVATLSNLARGESTAARGIAMQRDSIGNLIGFLEDAIAMTQYHHNPHSMLHMGHSPIVPPSRNMMCHCATALLALAKVPENHPGFILYENRLLDIAMSSALNSGISAIICDVLFQISKS